MYVHTYTNIHTYIHTYIHNKYSYIPTQSIAPNKMSYPAMHEQYAITIVPHFITCYPGYGQCVVDHRYAGNSYYWQGL